MGEGGMKTATARGSGLGGRGGRNRVVGNRSHTHPPRQGEWEQGSCAVSLRGSKTLLREKGDEGLPLTMTLLSHTAAAAVHQVLSQQSHAGTILPAEHTAAILLE